jgi:hypothetical protein
LWVVLGVIGVLFAGCTAIGIAAVVATGDAPSRAVSPSPTPTWELPSVSSPAPSADGVQETTPSREPTYTPKPADFKLTPKILKKQCFGSAGCNITYRILVDFVGAGTLDSATAYEVTYEVRGVEDGPAVNTFTVENGQSTVDSEEFGSTPSTATKLRAVATDVSETSG